ncbi:hypothetical protein, partial [Thermococcus sp. GR4]
MDEIKLLRGIASIAIIVAITLGLGFAVPDITVHTQPIGYGNCYLQSPISWATISLEWNKTGSIIQTWTLA